MPTLTSSPLSNGITPVSGTLEGMLALVYIGSPSYIYWDTAGNIYYQSKSTTPASSVPVHAAGFKVLCSEVVLATSLPTGYGFLIFLGGANGKYSFGSIDLAGTVSFINGTTGTSNLESVCYGLTDMGFMVGTSVGTILKFDCTIDSGTGFVPTNPLITTVATLPTTGIPNGATLRVRSIKFDPTALTSDYLIACTSSTNTLANVGTTPTTYDPNNVSIVFYGTLASLSSYTFTGFDFWLAAFGYVETTPPTKVKNLIVMGDDMRMAKSSNGTSWSIIPADANFASSFPKSLVFNTWVYIAPLDTAFIALSTDGVNWEKTFDYAMYFDTANLAGTFDMVAIANS